MNLTPKGLKKPSTTDAYDIEIQNSNMDMIDELIDDKVDKVEGKGLSANDYTLEEKIKLGGISKQATKVEASGINGNIKIDGLQAKVYDDSEISNRVGPLANLLTTIKTSIVNAINSLKGEVDEHKADFMPHGIDNAGFHNSIFRGKNLGTVVTQKQWDDIDNGSFEDMYVGDYWTRNGTVYRIAHINYYRNSGDSNLPPNHLTMVPDIAFYTHAMNDADTTTGGYTGSKMYTKGLTQARNKINTDFAGHVVTLRKYLCNAVTNGEASAAAWTDVDIDLMNEIMVYGTITCGRSVAGTLNRNVGTEKSQLALFQHQPDLINKREHVIWLKDIVSATLFARVPSFGFAAAGDASSATGVLPVFSIKK